MKRGNFFKLPKERNPTRRLEKGLSDRDIENWKKHTFNRRKISIESIASNYETERNGLSKRWSFREISL